MSGYVGDFPTGATVYLYWSTYDSSAASVTISNLAAGDIEIYKDGSPTQRASDAGYTLLDTDGIDFDGVTGIHGISIDLSDNTDAGFYAAGHEYMVMVGPITCDAQTINLIAGTFSIERSGGALALLKNATYGLSALETLVDGVESAIGTPAALDGGAATLAGMLTKLADDNGGADFDATTDSLTEIAAGMTTDAEIADAVLDEVVEGAYTMRQLLKLMSAALFGKASGGGTATVTFRDTGDSADRIVATVDANGNRTAVTLTPV